MIKKSTTINSWRETAMWLFDIGAFMNPFMNSLSYGRIHLSERMLGYKRKGSCALKVNASFQRIFLPIFSFSCFEWKGKILTKVESSRIQEKEHVYRAIRTILMRYLRCLNFSARDDILNEIITIIETKFKIFS